MALPELEARLQDGRFRCRSFASWEPVCLVRGRFQDPRTSPRTQQEFSATFYPRNRFQLDHEKGKGNDGIFPDSIANGLGNY